ncbi:hypothetical protein L3X38_025815 [Prunus dulcis]|uniref:Uncharacterized protein n=1 Tax=Prunus dulcis TaxID=3755 RepID=A0AAD4W375_PRUDU|nr:hypothetical protein L3X38_025815 [Prunus dulcis]
MAMVFRYVDKSGDRGIEHFYAKRQGYDEGSNMKALVAMTKGNADIATFFTSCNSFVNIVRASCKRRDMLRDQLQMDIMEALEKDTLPTRRGLNQETCLKRLGDTHWNSHYETSNTRTEFATFSSSIRD